MTYFANLTAAAILNPTAIPVPPFSRWKIYGELHLTMYAICIMTGVAFAIWISRVRYQRRGGNPERILDVIMWGLPLGIIGARTYHVLTVPWDYFGPHGDPWKIPQIWLGGIAIFGGLTTGLIVTIIVLRYYGQRVAPFLDSVVPAVALAQGIGRLGNYFNQELFGGPTTLPWGLHLDAAHMPPGYPPGTLFHPTFLYELIWDVTLAATLVIIDRKYRDMLKGLQLTSIYIVGYGIGRFIVESMRTDHAQVFLGIRLNGWTALGVICLGICLFFVARFKGGSTKVEPSDNPQQEEEELPDKSDKSRLDKPVKADKASEKGEKSKKDKASEKGEKSKKDKALEDEDEKDNASEKETEKETVKEGAEK